MEWNVRFMTAMVALFGSLAIAVVGVWWATSDTPPYPSTAPAPLPQVANRKAPQGAIYVQGRESLQMRARIEDLEAELRRQERLVAAKNRELEEKQSTLVELRAEVKSSYDFASLLMQAADDAILEVTPPTPLASPTQPPIPMVSVEPLPEQGDPILDPLQPTAPELSETEVALQAARERLTELQSEAALRRAAQIEVIRRIGPNAVNGLIDALESPRAEVRAWACEALTDLGRDGSAAAEALRLLANDPDAEVRLRAAVALQAVRE